MTDFQWLCSNGAGSPDQRTAHNVLDTIIPSARRWAFTDDEHAVIDAAEAQARATLQSFEVAA
jgi:hypothetical protein